MALTNRTTRSILLSPAWLLWLFVGVPHHYFISAEFLAVFQLVLVSFLHVFFRGSSAFRGSYQLVGAHPTNSIGTVFRPQIGRRFGRGGRRPAVTLLTISWNME